MKKFLSVLILCLVQFRFRRRNVVWAIVLGLSTVMDVSE